MADDRSYRAITYSPSIFLEVPGRVPLGTMLGSGLTPQHLDVMADRCPQQHCLNFG